MNTAWNIAELLFAGHKAQAQRMAQAESVQIETDDETTEFFFSDESSIEVTRDDWQLVCTCFGKLTPSEKQPPQAPIVNPDASVSKAEFDAVCGLLAASLVYLRPVTEFEGPDCADCQDIIDKATPILEKYDLL